MKKNLKIAPENKVQINDIINEIEGKAQVRCIDYDDIEKAVNKVDEKLSLISKTARIGVEVDVDIYAQTFPNSYMKAGTPMSTQFHAVRKKDGWVLTDVVRAYCHCSNYRIRTTLPDGTKEAILKAFEKWA